MYGYLEGMHPVKTAETVAVEIHVSSDAVRKWARGDGAPSLPVLLRLVRRYGLQILAVMYGDEPMPDGLEAAIDRAEIAELSAMGAAILARIERLERR